MIDDYYIFYIFNFDIFTQRPLYYAEQELFVVILQKLLIHLFAIVISLYFMTNLQNSVTIESVAPSYLDTCLNVILVICFVVGVFKLGKFAFTLFGHFFRRRLNLANRYGGGWAVVTGGSEGIGLSIAKQLAKQQFNIILVSRNKSKLEKAKEQVSKINGNIQIIIKSVDFESLLPLQYPAVFADILSKDVSILVNNVGNYLPHYFTNNSFQELRRQMKINCFPISIVSRLFLPKMIQRKQRSGMINLSSGSATAAFTGCSHYSATKVFDDYLSQVLAYQYRPKIDVLTVRPWMVTSAMTRNMDSPIFTSTEKCASSVVNELGQQGVCYGPLVHRLQGALVELVSPKIAGAAMSQTMRQIDVEYYKRA